MPRHFAIEFWKLIIPRQWGADTYILSLQMYCVHRIGKTKENLDKNRVLIAISRDKQ